MSLVAGDSWLLADKLRVPRLNDDICRRGRVTGLLEEAVRHRVTLVTGPAGAGKTVACATWAAGAAAAKHHRVAWLTVGESDCSPERFWADVAAAIEGEPVAGAICDLPSPASPVVLVLDDIHELADSEAAAGLDLLIHHAPPTLRLVLAGRFAPGLQLAKLRLGGDLAALDEEDLACAENEAQDCFGRLGLDADPAGRAALLRYTEGWMAGLRLVSLTGGTDPGASAVAAEYLRDEILGRQPAAIRDFLLRVSVAGELTAGLAGCLTGADDSGRTLERLCHENSFVHLMGAERYRLHPFVRDMLGAELRRRAPDAVPALLGKAAGWYADYGETAEAARFAADAGDWPLAARMVADGGLTGLLPERAGELAAALSALPGEDPLVQSALAAARLCRGAPLHWAERPVPSQPHLQLWGAALRVMAETGAEGSDGWKVATERSATAQTPQEQRALGVLWAALGTSALCRSDVQSACTALDQAERHFASTGPAAMRERAAGWLALAAALGGDLTAAESRTTATAPACLAALTAAQCALDRDELVAAAASLDEARAAAFATLPAEPDPVPLGELIRARVRLADGDIPGARVILAGLREHPHADQRQVGVLAAEIALQAGELPLPGAHDGPLMHGRILLARGDAAGALAMAECQAGDGTLRERLAALLVAALAQRRLGGQDAAAGLLERALTLAEPHRISRPFLDGGAQVRSALVMLMRPQSPAASFAARVLQRFSYQAPAGQHRSDTAIPLTESEVSVLRFLSSHLTNQEIADALCLSINTVKTHLRTAYRKLGVTTRRAAIARAERLGLIS